MLAERFELSACALGVRRSDPLSYASKLGVDDRIRTGVSLHEKQGSWPLEDIDIGGVDEIRTRVSLLERKGSWPLEDYAETGAASQARTDIHPITVTRVETEAGIAAW